MDNRAIGIFDSGLGGLTTLKELHRLLPRERLIYFGDTGRVPYGTRSSATIRKYALQDMAFLQKFDVKIILIACGTVSSNWTPEMAPAPGVAVSGVVGPAARAACRASKNGRIGVIATSATIRSDAFTKEIRRLRPDARVTGVACPLFVPLVENGLISPDNSITRQVAELYLRPLLETDLDTLILGCTHYPLILEIIDSVLEHRVRLIDAGLETARWAKEYLERQSLCAEEGGGREYYVSDSAALFSATAHLFLGESIQGNVTQVDLEQLAAE